MIPNEVWGFITIHVLWTDQPSSWLTFLEPILFIRQPKSSSTHVSLHIGNYKESNICLTSLSRHNGRYEDGFPHLVDRVSQTCFSLQGNVSLKCLLNTTVNIVDWVSWTTLQTRLGTSFGLETLLRDLKRLTTKFTSARANLNSVTSYSPAVMMTRPPLHWIFHRLFT